MKQVFLALPFDSENSIVKGWGHVYLPGLDNIHCYFDKAQLVEKAKEMGLKSPKSKIVIFQAIAVVEPRSIEFAEKQYNDRGELVI